MTNRGDAVRRRFLSGAVALAAAAPLGLLAQGARLQPTPECNPGRGTPAQTERRSVADHSFDYATSFHFKSYEDHQFYQSQCPEHARFVAICASFWERVVIYDVEPLG